MVVDIVIQAFRYDVRVGIRFLFPFVMPLGIVYLGSGKIIVSCYGTVDSVVSCRCTPFLFVSTVGVVFLGRALLRKCNKPTMILSSIPAAKYRGLSEGILGMRLHLRPKSRCFAAVGLRNACLRARVRKPHPEFMVCRWYPQPQIPVRT